MALLSLLPSQRNSVFEAIVTAGLKPPDFEWSERVSAFDSKLFVSRLTHKPSGYWFQFDEGSRGGPYALYQPGNESPRGEEYPGEWAKQLGCVHDWLSYLNREITAPDLWSIASGPPISSGASNEPFSATELTLIGERLALIEKRIGEVRALQEGEAKFVHESLDYLKQAAETEGRRNWVNMAIGLMLQVLMFLALPPEHAGGIFRYAVDQLQAFGVTIVGAPPLPLPGPPPQPR